MVLDGDEFNRAPLYHCAKCGHGHGSEYPGCNGLRGGYTPPAAQDAKDGHRLVERQLLEPDPPMTHFKGVSRLYRPPAEHGDAIQWAVDDYLLMERKARAWDELRAMAGRMDGPLPVKVDLLDGLVHSAQTDSSR